MMRELEPLPAPMQRQHHRNQPRLNGLLRLRFESLQAMRQTVLRVCDQRPPLKVVRAFQTDHGGVLVHLHNVSGGVLGGDRLELEVEVGPSASVQLTSTGATRLYRSHKGAPTALQVTKIGVCADGLLEYLPDPLIPFAGSRYRQETTIELAAGAGLFWWETVAPGRAARGELFEYDLLEIKVDLVAEGRPLALERVRLEPARRPLSSLARLGPYNYFSTFYICRSGVEASRWLALEKGLGELAQRLSSPAEALWGVSTLPANGLVVRALSVRGRDITAGLLAFWRAAKQHLYGQDAILPRKVY
ncbi:MAG TPA: urease accessory protein UreD [Pyrinomonadaceae bacterium]|nr:urease accessory protein UreD [Pyrinomonadaceae bacterium]